MGINYFNYGGIGFIDYPRENIVVVVVVFIDTERSVLTHESYKTYNTHTHVKTSNWTINFDDKNTQHH